MLATCLSEYRALVVSSYIWGFLLRGWVLSGKMCTEGHLDDVLTCRFEGIKTGPAVAYVPDVNPI